MTTTAVLPTHQDEEQLFRAVFGTIPSGVTVLTTITREGAAGMTASAVCPLSLRPPLALACVNSRSATLSAILDHGSFAINVLDSESAAISAAFSYPCSQRQRFTGVRHRIERGLPVLSDALAWATCKIHATHRGGDHTILVGAVTGMARDAGEPLVHHQGRYRVLR